MVADHWFQQIEKVLEAMDITSDAAEIRLAAFQLEGESQVWWDWVKTSRVLEAMTWAEFYGLFMSKYFSATARHAKARRFENGLKLSIRGKIMGLHLQDMDSMVGTALAIEREIQNARRTRDASVSVKRKESQSSSSSGKKPRASNSRGFQSHDHLCQG